MFRIVMNLGGYSANLRGTISLIVGCALAVAVFVFLVGPVHNFIQAKFIKLSGDDWVEDAGYFSLNPVNSFHWIGTASALVVLMGFTKRVRYRRRYFHRPVLSTIGLSLTGVLSYLACAVVFTFIYTLIGSFEFYGMANPSVMPSEELPFWGCVFHALFAMVLFLSRICVYSALFNLIPVPPMDMGEVVFLFLGHHWSDVVKKNDLIISVGLFVIAFFILGMPDSFLVNASYSIIEIMEDAFRFIFKLFV